MSRSSRLEQRHQSDRWHDNAEASDEQRVAYGIEHRFAALAGERDTTYRETHLDVRAHRDRFSRSSSKAFARPAAAE